MLSLGILGYALMSCATVEKALYLLRRYNQAVLPSMTIDIVTHEASATLVGSGSHLPTHLERFYTDTLFSALVTNLRLLTGKADLGAVLQLRYHPLDNINRYGSIFGESVAFNAEKSALTFSQESLELAITYSNPQAQTIFQRECDRILAVDGNSGSVSERIKQILISARLKFPSAAEMAREMYMSESTLQRRLSNEGSSYQTLLDQVRYRLALEYLNGTQLPVSEVAELLGYSSAANFRRSFKRWSGMTPREIRSA
jgi:AraC-like DNA-binding protein